MSKTIRIWERIVESKVREKVCISGKQFVFMPGKRAMDAVMAMRKLVKRSLKTQKDVHTAFIDLEKAYDTIPRKSNETGDVELYESKGLF